MLQSCHEREMVHCVPWYTSRCREMYLDSGDGARAVPRRAAQVAAVDAVHKLRHFGRRWEGQRRGAWGVRPHALQRTPPPRER